jgi:hypothetical protein
MPDRLPSTAYKCIIPVEKPTLPSTVYHSSVHQLGEAAQKEANSLKPPPFPAWPEIEEPWQPLCFPTLARAIYFIDHSPVVEIREAAALAEKYLEQHPETINSKVIQQATAMSNFYLQAMQQLKETGRFPKSHTLHSPTFHTTFASFFDTIKKLGWVSGTAAVETILQSGVYGQIANFYGPQDAFAWAHEHAHHLARWLYSSITINDQAAVLHHALNLLITTPKVPPDDIIRFWKVFEKENNRLIYIVQRFEPIEEIFATYIGLRHSPPEVRRAVEDEIEQKLREQNLYELYKAFAEACDTCQVNTPLGAAYMIMEMKSRILKDVKLNIASVLDTMILVSKSIWQSIERKIEKKGDLDQTEKDTLEEEITNHLEHAGIPVDIVESIAEADAGIPSNLNPLLAAIAHSFSRAEDLDLIPPLVLLTGLVSRSEVTPFIYPKPTNKDITLSLIEKIFLESIRQQLSQHCGLFCPFAQKGKHCCNRRRKLRRIWYCLPDEDRAHFIPPDCDLIR